MNGVFSVLFKKRCQYVLCVISRFFFVCLFVLIYTVSQKSFKGWFLATFLESRFQHWQYNGVGSVSFLAEKAENW